MIPKISVNIADFYCMTLDSNCDDTFRPTCVDNLRQQYVSSSCKQNM